MIEGGSGGRTRWKRFAAVMVLGGLGAGVLTVGLSQGALAASFTVSGTPYKAAIDKLDATGVVQYGDIDRSAHGAHPVLVNGFRHATADNFCQSILMPGVPGLGDVTIRLTAPGRNGFNADNLVLGVQDVDADLTLTNVEIGRDSGALDKGPGNAKGVSGGFGIQADSAELTNVRQLAWSTTASTLRLNQVGIHVSAGKNECY